MYRLSRRLKNYENFLKLSQYCRTIHIALIVYLLPNFFINRQDMDLMYHLIGVAAGLGAVAESELWKLRKKPRREFEESVVDDVSDESLVSEWRTA